jgi:hypothetical protein
VVLSVSCEFLCRYLISSLLLLVLFVLMYIYFSLNLIWKMYVEVFVTPSV